MASLLDYAADPQHLDKMGNTALHCCALYMQRFSPEYRAMVNKLLQHKIDINAHNHAGKTAVHIAVQRHLFPLTHHLLQNEANPNLKEQRTLILNQSLPS